MMSKYRRQEKILRGCGLEQQRTEPQLASPMNVSLPSNDPEMYTVYGEDWCGWTTKARNLLQQRAIPFRFHRLGADRRQFARLYANDQRTIPIVFRGSKFLGGYDQLVAELEA